MRTLICILIVIMFSLSASAQCGDAPAKRGEFYFEPLVKASAIRDEAAHWLGGKLGWKLTKHSSLGWEANALISDNTPPVGAGRLEMTYTGGVLSCYTSRVNRLGFGFDLLFGAGWIELDVPEGAYLGGADYSTTTCTNSFTFFEPTGYVTFRYSPHFSLNTGTGTLITGGIDRWGYTNADFYKVMWTAGVRVE